VDRNWDVNPDSTSKYEISRWSIEKVLIRGNQLSDCSRGIWLYTGGTDTDIVDNTLTNAEGIYLRADNRPIQERYNLIWNMSVTNNTVIDNKTSTTGQYHAYIGTEVRIGDNSLDGTGVLGTKFKNNTVDAGTLAHNPSSGDYIPSEGYFNRVMLNSGYNSDMDTKALLGTIFQDNKIMNNRYDYAYRLSTGAYQTILWNTIDQTSNEFLNDNVNTGAGSIASMDTKMNFASVGNKDVNQGTGRSFDVTTSANNAYIADGTEGCEYIQSLELYTYQYLSYSRNSYLYC